MQRTALRWRGPVSRADYWKSARKRTPSVRGVGPDPEFGPAVPMKVGPRSSEKVVADQCHFILAETHAQRGVPQSIGIGVQAAGLQAIAIAAVADIAETGHPGVELARVREVRPVVLTGWSSPAETPD